MQGLLLQSCALGSAPTPSCTCSAQPRVWNMHILLPTCWDDPQDEDLPKQMEFGQCYSAKAQSSLYFLGNWLVRVFFSLSYICDREIEQKR